MFDILEFDRSKRRIVGGRKDIAAKEAQQRREELFSRLEVGQQVEGTVSRLVDFGAFVDLGGVDGLVHVSEASWNRIRKISDVLGVGDLVTAYVIAIDPEKGKISLSLKDAKANPWNNIAEKYPVGKILHGTVVRLATFGAFVNLEEGIDGLVHISQLADKHVVKPDDVVKTGQVINVKVVAVDEEHNRISLSKREADEYFANDYDDAYDDQDEHYDDSYDDAYADDFSSDISETNVEDLSGDGASAAVEMD